MPTFNLTRNSRVLFTTNVATGTGIIQPTGFTAANTQELQVLDGFSFSQSSNADTVTISEAGNTPTRGQRAFNTSLNNVEFSFSTYIRPRLVGGTVRAEEAVLWNALLCNVPIGTAAAFTATGITTSSVALDAAGVITIPGTAMVVSGLTVGETYVIKGVTGLGAYQYNTAVRILTASATSITAQYLVRPTAAVLTTGWNTSVTMVRTAWNDYPVAAGDTTAPQTSGAPAAYSVANSNLSNRNQLLPFGMIMTVDGVTYAIDNCAMDQAVVDFGLDGIAMVAWTGKGTALRQLGGASAIATTTTSNAVMTVGVSTSNAGLVAVGQTVSGPGIPSGTTVSTIGTYTFGAGGTVTLSATPTVAATNANFIFGVGTNANANVVYSSAQDPALSGPITGTATGKVTTANFITNKLSTLQLIRNIGGIGTGNTSYTMALTGGSITIANNISYVTPANLGVVNVPIGYYTGTRSITGSVTAYLRTGSTNSAGLLSDLLAASATAAGVEPKFMLEVDVGGLTNGTRVEIDVPGAMLQIPSIDAQAVMSTTINFTAQGTDSVQGATANYDLELPNELEVRYLSL